MSVSGVGVHSGRPVNLTLCPAPVGHGISFLRRLGPGQADVRIPALAASLGGTERCTTLGVADAPHSTVATVEHVMAALVGLKVDNCLIEIDGAEVPAMDGSAAPFVEAIDRVGTVAQAAPRRVLRILRPVRVATERAFAEFLPYRGSRFEVAIDFECPLIGAQSMALDLTPSRFRREIAAARTFGHAEDVDRLRAAGLALGASLDNAVVIGGGAVLNPDGLRFRDEFVRHKLLDAVGDLALAGAPIEGIYRSYRGGHRLNGMALAALLAQPDAWAWVVHEEAAAPRRKLRESRGDFLGGILQPAVGPAMGPALGPALAPDFS